MGADTSHGSDHPVARGAAVGSAVSSPQFCSPSNDYTPSITALNAVETENERGEKTTMKVEEVNSGEGRARACDSCRSAASAVYCGADSAYLCISCDARIHAADRMADRRCRSEGEAKEQEEAAGSAWVVANGVKKSSDESYGHGREVDEYLDLPGFDGSYNYDSCGLRKT